MKEKKKSHLNFTNVECEEEKLKFPSDEDNHGSDVYCGVSMIPEVDSDQNENSEEQEDDDSGPEEISFKTQAQKSQKAMKRIAEEISKSKEYQKKKRRELHLRNKLQKEDKIKRLNSKKLPDDILESIDAIPQGVAFRKQSELQPTKAVFEKDNKDVDEFQSQADFISINGPTTFKVKVLEEELKKPNPIPNEIANFKNRALFGKKNRREETTRSYLAKREKQIIGGKL